MAFFDDLHTFFLVRLYNLKDFLRTVFRYYRKPKFALLDLSLLLSYFLKSPYRIGREFNEVEPYGETPLATMEEICKACPIGPEDVVFELGSGRGRTSFWLAFFQPCKHVVGVEYIPQFVKKASKLASIFKVRNVEFRNVDMSTTDLEKATWIYLFGTALPDDTIMTLLRRFESLPRGAKIITVSYSLLEYAKSDSIMLIKTIDVEFAWGITTAFIHEVQK
jgi:hypothetical protein